MMKSDFKIVLAFVFLASMPLYLGAKTQNTTGDVLTAKEVRQAEASAKTASDHERIATYYQAQAERAQQDLERAQDMIKQWSWMRLSKAPNPYTQALALAETSKAQLKNFTKLANDQERMMAQSVEASSSTNE